MNDLWNTLLQWLHRVGLHPDRTAVEQAGGAVLDSASAAAAGVGQAVGSMDMASLLALAAALGWASGFRLYLVVFLVGLLGATGALVLPGSLQMLAHPAVFAAVLAVTVVLMWVVTWMLWRFLKTALRKLRGWMGAVEPAPPQLPKT